MKVDKQQLIARVAYLYYVEELKQEKIAQELNVDRSTISRMLTQAKKMGIVEIKIKHFDPRLFSLEQQFKEQFGLKNVELAPTNYSESELKKEEQLAKTAQSWLRRQVKDQMVIGVAWGATLAQLIEQLEEKQLKDIVTVPIVGGPSHVRSQFHVNTLVYELAKKFQGTSVFINAMAIQETPEVAKGILHSNYFQELRKYWQHLDLAIVGIGGPLKNQPSQWRDLLTSTDLNALKLREAIADCCCRFLDVDGKILHTELDQRTLGLSLEDLSKVPTSVAVARGKGKAASILAVLRSQTINTLITDQETAEEILRLANK